MHILHCNFMGQRYWFQIFCNLPNPWCLYVPCIYPIFPLTRTCWSSLLVSSLQTASAYLHLFSIKLFYCTSRFVLCVIKIADIIVFLHFECCTVLLNVVQILSKEECLNKEPGLIASDFCQTFWDFGIRRKLIFFLLPLMNFTAKNVPFGRYQWKYD